MHKRAKGKIGSTNSGFKAPLNVGSKLQYRPKAPSSAPKGSNETGPKNGYNSSAKGYGNLENDVSNSKGINTCNPFDILSAMYIEKSVDVQPSTLHANPLSKVVQPVDVSEKVSKDGFGSNTKTTQVNENKVLEEVVTSTKVREVNDGINNDNENQVEEVFDETACFMASASSKASKSGSGA